jgi:uncharacterized protein (DUF3084 family)
MDFDLRASKLQKEAEQRKLEARKKREREQKLETEQKRREEAQAELLLVRRAEMEAREAELALQREAELVKTGGINFIVEGLVPVGMSKRRHVAHIHM